MADQAVTAPGAAPLVNVAGRRYTLAVFMLLQVFYYTDRNVLTILQEPIRLEMGLSDSQMGALTGIAFALAYCLFSIPIGRLSDTRNRIAIIAISSAVWSLFTALFGLGRNYLALVGMRIGVAAGESGGLLAMQSVVADLYEPRRRGSALAILTAAGTVGTMFGFAAAGYLNDAFGWRITFAALGLAGLAITPLVLTLKEPKRGGAEDFEATAVAEPLSVMASLKELAGRRAFLLLVVGFMSFSIVSFGYKAWLPTFLIRRFGMGTGEVGLFTTGVTVAPMLVGMVLGGLLGDRLFRTRPSWVLRLPAVCLAVSLVATLAQIWSPSLLIVGLAGLLPALASGFYLAPLMSGLHALAGVRLRGFALALVGAGTLLMGQGVGPAIVGLISDMAGGAAAGYHSLQTAIAAICVLYLVGAVVLFMAGGSFQRDVDRVQVFDGRPT